jgi:Flp pilus assembly protein TadD
MIRMARGWFSDTPVVLAMVAQTEIRRGNLSSALTALLEVERMAETGKFDRTISTHPKILNEALFTNLALVAHQLGRLDVARRNYERLLAVDPGNTQMRSNLDRLGSITSDRR